MRTSYISSHQHFSLSNHIQPGSPQRAVESKPTMMRRKPSERPPYSKRPSNLAPTIVFHGEITKKRCKKWQHPKVISTATSCFFLGSGKHLFRLIGGLKKINGPILEASEYCNEPGRQWGQVPLTSAKKNLLSPSFPNRWSMQMLLLDLVNNNT